MGEHIVEDVYTYIMEYIHKEGLSQNDMLQLTFFDGCHYCVFPLHLSNSISKELYRRQPLLLQLNPSKSYPIITHRRAKRKRALSEDLDYKRVRQE